MPYQERHEELMQINYLDAAHFQSHFTIHLRHISIGFPCSSIWIKWHLKSEDFISHYWDSLEDEDCIVNTTKQWAVIELLFKLLKDKYFHKQINR